jgi:hypothetical protein
MHGFILLLFAFAGGQALSGIVTNAYRLLVHRRDGPPASWFSYGILLFAGPCVLFENSTRSFRRRECSTAAYSFALGLAVCWSSLLGLAMVHLGSRY